MNDNIKDILSKIDFIKRNYYSLQGGIEIPQYADLNDYKSVGNYYCPANITTPTLSNKPSINEAFVLKVYHANGTSGYIAQRLYIYWTGKTYSRTFDIYCNRWSDWILL